MPRDPDAYAIWGDWDLRGFKVVVPRWRHHTHPPDHVANAVEVWWPRLKQPLEWGNAPRVALETDPAGTLRWLWVPGAAWDDDGTHFRVQCFFRVIETVTPPQILCDSLVTVPALTPGEPGEREE